MKVYNETEIAKIKHGIKAASRSGLVAEVIYDAMELLKACPEITFGDAIITAVEGWRITEDTTIKA